MDMCILLLLKKGKKKGQHFVLENSVEGGNFACFWVFFWPPKEKNQNQKLCSWAYRFVWGVGAQKFRHPTRKVLWNNRVKPHLLERSLPQVSCLETSSKTWSQRLSVRSSAVYPQNPCLVYNVIMKEEASGSFVVWFYLHTYWKLGVSRGDCLAFRNHCGLHLEQKIFLNIVLGQGWDRGRHELKRHGQTLTHTRSFILRAGNSHACSAKPEARREPCHSSSLIQFVWCLPPFAAGGRSGGCWSGTALTSLAQWFLRTALGGSLCLAAQVASRICCILLTQLGQPVSTTFPIDWEGKGGHFRQAKPLGKVGGLRRSSLCQHRIGGDRSKKLRPTASSDLDGVVFCVRWGISTPGTSLGLEPFHCFSKNVLDICVGIGRKMLIAWCLRLIGAPPSRGCRHILGQPRIVLEVLLWEAMWGGAWGCRVCSGLCLGHLGVDLQRYQISHRGNHQCRVHPCMRLHQDSFRICQPCVWGEEALAQVYPVSLPSLLIGQAKAITDWQFHTGVW